MLSKLKVWKKILTNYRTFLRRKKWSEGGEKNNDNEVFFDLSDIRQEPYYFPIIFSFHESGYKIRIANRLKFIGHSFGSGRYIYELPNVVIGNGRGDKKELLITDNKTVFDKATGWEKKILLKPFDMAKNNGSSIILPYQMHPNAYHFGYYKDLVIYRKAHRKYRILFSGNTEPKAYQNPVIRNKYKKLNRIEVIEALTKNLNPEKVYAIKAKEDQAQLPETYFNGLLLYLWQWSPMISKALDIRVPNEQWHGFLAKGDFFLCCSGIVIPQSHNAIEAMSVGSIPILEYAELFHPALVHGENCIVYTNKLDLIEKVNEVFRLTESQINNMRKKVIDYYEKYLHHTYTASLIKGLHNGEQEVYFYNEAY